MFESEQALNEARRKRIDAYCEWQETPDSWREQQNVELHNTVWNFTGKALTYAIAVPFIIGTVAVFTVPLIGAGVVVYQGVSGLVQNK